MIIVPYNRKNAVSYAKQWAFSRNPQYYDFSRLGGDCTNFASQCLFAGCQIMNFTPTFGWYYRSLNNRSPAWTGVTFFYRFLTDNTTTPIGDGAGPFAKETSIDELELGDFIQLGRREGEFYHTLLVVGFKSGVPLVAAHTNDAFNRPIT
ncbi:MAG: amidase domain-containing protein, partial [Clostridia bacterium]|nr:amidase domain-containing protein [Clostridia bacterium]